jgi:hypothetical protein
LARNGDQQAAEGYQDPPWGGSSLAGLWRPGPLRPERGPGLHFRIGHGIAMLPDCPLRGRAWSGCPRPMRRNWLRRNRLRSPPAQPWPEGFLAFALKMPTRLGSISLVMLPSGGLGQQRTRRRPGRCCPACFVGVGLTSRSGRSAVPPECSGHAAGPLEPPARSPAPAAQTTPSVGVRSGGAA